MDKYTIYCTEKQAKKALELDAPIEKVDTRDKRMIYYGHLCYPRTEADYPYAIPTAEQIIGWLEEYDLFISIDKTNDGCFWLWDIYDNEQEYIKGCGVDRYSSRKAATLAAIDAALDYLT